MYPLFKPLTFLPNTLFKYKQTNVYNEGLMTFQSRIHLNKKKNLLEHQNFNQKIENNYQLNETWFNYKKHL